MFVRIVQFAAIIAIISWGALQPTNADTNGAVKPEEEKHILDDGGEMVACPRCVSLDRVLDARPVPNALALRSPTGPACLDKELLWRGRPNTVGKLLGGLVDKAYVIHYSGAAKRKARMLETLSAAGIPVDDHLGRHLGNHDYNLTRDRAAPPSAGPHLGGGVALTKHRGVVGGGSGAVDFVESYDRENIPHALATCVRCGYRTAGPAVCSVNLKHVAAYRDMVRHGHGLSLLLEDDIALTGPRAVTPTEAAQGLEAWPPTNKGLFSLAHHHSNTTAASATSKSTKSTATTSNLSPFALGVAAVLAEAKVLKSTTQTANANDTAMAVIDRAAQPIENEDEAAAETFGHAGAKQRSASGGGGGSVESEMGFDTVVLGECVFVRWLDKHPFATKVSKHLYQPLLKFGASKCVGAVLVSQRGARRLLQALPFSKDGLYNASDGLCYRGRPYPDHHLNTARRLAGDAFVGLWAVPELASEMAMEPGEAHIWRQAQPATKQPPKQTHQTTRPKLAQRPKPQQDQQDQQQQQQQQRRRHLLPHGSAQKGKQRFQREAQPHHRRREAQKQWRRSLKEKGSALAGHGEKEGRGLRGAKPVKARHKAKAPPATCTSPWDRDGDGIDDA